jgi:hypothetical protein
VDRKKTIAASQRRATAFWLLAAIAKSGVPFWSKSAVTADTGQHLQRIRRPEGNCPFYRPIRVRLHRWYRLKVCLTPGDLLVIYTDGFSEAMNPHLEEWGENRLISAIVACNSLPAKDSIARIMQAADAFASGAPQSDDMTLVILRAV